MGLIPKTAVKDFFARERRDVRPFKKTSLAELRRIKDELPIRPPIWKRLNRHQRVCFLLGVSHSHFGFHLDTGMGKTLLSIALARYFQKENLGDRKVMVLVPNKINLAEWAREMRKWGQHGRYLVLKGSSKQKWVELRGTDALFVVATYAGFIRMACTLQEATKGKGKGKGRGKRKRQVLKPDIRLVRELQGLVGGLILDEATNVASRSALATRICKQLRKTAAFLFELTGTPFGRDPTMLHSQLALIDDGWSLGETLGLFRAAFFSEKRNFWGGFEYTFKRDMEPRLNRFLAHSTVRYEVDQSDLPDYIPIVKVVSLPEDAEVYAEKAMEQLRAAKGNYQATRNGFLRMCQVSSGWIGYEGDEDGKRAQLEFEHNPKMEMLLSLIGSTDHKCIVFHEFVFSGSIIGRELSKHGVGWARISGATTQHERILYDFDHDARCRVLILNNKMCLGPNLQAAKYGIWYEAPCSCILRKQGRRRFERQHSEHKKVFGVDLVVRGTYDQHILDAHAAGEDLFEQIVNGRAKP